MTPDQFAQDWDRSLAFLISKGEEALAAMTDDSQPDVQPGLEWWTYDALAQSDSQPAEAYVWTAPIGPTPEQAKEAEQARVWSLVELFARGG